MWGEYEVYPSAAQQVFQQNQQVWQAANQLNNPCTIGAFYGGSALIGAVGAAAANSSEMAAAATENYPTLYYKFTNWLFAKAADPGPVGAVGAGLTQAGQDIGQFCNSF
jgi:hypothetical protein